MALNGTGTSTNATTNNRSVIHCTHASNFTWDLSETTVHWILLPITFIASLATIILNLLIILAVQRKRELKKTSTILLSSMAIADLLVGAVSMPLTVTADILIIRQVYHSSFCTLLLATEYSMITLIWCSLYHLTFIAWERFVAIRKWIDYTVIVKRGRITVLVIVAWLLAAFTSLPPLVMVVAGVDQNIKEAWYIGETVLAALCLTIIGYFYVMVYLGVRNRKINEISQVSAIVKAKQESKVAMTCGLIAVALILSFVPGIVVGALGAVFPDLLTSRTFRLPDTLIQLTSLANPLIYFYKDRSFRNAALELLGIRRAEAIQPAVDAVRFVRRKDPFGSKQDVQELQNDEQHTRCKIAASCDPAVGSCCDLRRSREIPLKTSMSAHNGSEDGLKLQRSSSMVVTTAIIHTKPGRPYQSKTSNGKSPQDAIKPQDTSNLVRKKPRSKSWDASASVKCANRTCQMLEETPVQRPTSVPYLQSERKCSPKLTKDSGFSRRL